VIQKPKRIALTNPNTAYHYAKNVIKGRFSQGEPIIATSPEYAYLYACDVIKGRWEQAEPIIATDPYYALWYANDVIKGRFELAEPVIAANDCWACRYASYIIQGRWEQAESTIMTNNESIRIYVLTALKSKLIYMDFYIKCIENNMLDIHDLPKRLRNHSDIQVAYFKAKVLK
jgi:hypothetical protein